MGFDHRVEDRQQLAHRRGDGHFERLAFADEPLDERLDHRVVFAGAEGRHAQGRPEKKTGREENG